MIPQGGRTAGKDYTDYGGQSDRSGLSILASVLPQYSLQRSLLLLLGLILILLSCACARLLYFSLTLSFWFSNARPATTYELPCVLPSTSSWALVLTIPYFLSYPSAVRSQAVTKIAYLLAARKHFLRRLAFV